LNGRAAVGQGFSYGLLILILTALIGLTNATKIIGDLSHDTLLTHLHSGTLGWITIGVVSIAAWVFGASSPNLGRNLALTAIATAFYVLAFWSGNFIARAVFGTIELAVILAWWWFVASASMKESLGRVDVPKLGILLALTTLVIGSTLGVIVQIQLATNTAGPQTGQLIGTHAAAQVAGYLVLVAAAIAEWQLIGSGRRTLAGVIQNALLFIAGLSLAIGFLLNITPFLLLANLSQTVGIVMVLVRLGRRAIGVPWGAATGARHVAISLAWLVVSLILTIRLTQLAIAAGPGSGGAGPDLPPGLLNALNHSYFVGLMTNVLFGTILAYTADRPRVWPWADHVIFWGLNLGAAAFVIVLLTVGTSAGAATFAHPVAFTAPIMGLSVLLGIATYLQRLRTPSVAAAAMPV
jgi:hypothetical protein